MQQDRRNETSSGSKMYNVTKRNNQLKWTVIVKKRQSGFVASWGLTLSCAYDFDFTFAFYPEVVGCTSLPVQQRHDTLF